MSSDEPSNANVGASSSSDRRDAVREKAQLVQATQARSRRIRTATLVSAIVAVVVVTAVVVTWAVSSAASRPMLSPANVTDDGFVITTVSGVAADAEPGVVDATPTPTPTESAAATAAATPAPTDQPVVEIRVYVDYLSSGSRDFQVANVAQLSKWVDEGAATLSYYPVAMLTAKSNGTKYSVRAASAAACVGTYSPATFFAYNNALLSQQPGVDSDGLTDVELADIAIASGSDSPKVVRACIEEQKYVTWAKAATERALGGLPGTDGVALTGAPMVLVNGVPYVGALDDPAEFAQFVLTLASEAFYKETASPTPTPSATPSATP
jgi:hypothetical protein